jgi:hypothetical protein
MRAMSCRLIMALKATVEPRLMSARRQVQVQVKMTEFEGTVGWANCEFLSVAV